MEPIYAAALNILSHTQPSRDGGLFAYILDNIAKIPTVNGDIVSFYPLEQALSNHVFSTFARTRYAISITSGLLWIIILVAGAIYLCCKKRRKSRRNTGLVFLSNVNNGIAEASIPMLITDSIPTVSEKTFFKRRRELQSHWPWLAFQFFFFSLLTILLATGVLLAFTVSSHLHSNLASPPAHEETIGRLLTPAELEHVTSSRKHVFPSLLRALAQLRAYLLEFVHQTKNHTTPVVDELIQATENMQDRMTNEFNAILFEKIGVSEAFAQGDLLGASVISLITHSMAVVEQDALVKARFEKLKIELQNWLRLVSNFGPSLNDAHCDRKCQSLHKTFVGNLTARPDSFMPPFTFAIALKFVTTDRNQTAETVQAQLNQGKILADKQLAETKRIMAERINIPKSIRDMTNRQWDQLSSHLQQPIQTIDQIASTLTRSISPKISSGSSIVLVVGCIFWSFILVFTIGVTWLVIHYHCVPSKLSRHDRHRIRSAASCGLLLFALSLLFAVILFLCAGYAFTEVCRYLDPGQKMITVSIHDVTLGTYTKETVFPLDSHINQFLTQHWSEIETVFKQHTNPGEKQMPIPRIRSPIYALTHRCREDVGILEAFDSIRNFNMSHLNDPEMSQRFVNMGREIMMDSLKAIDPNEMFPVETDEQLAMAGRLDDFIVDFDELRQNLPKTYFSVRDAEEESVNYRPYAEQTMWNDWKMYREIMMPNLNSEQIGKLDNATQQVRLGLMQLSAYIQNISGHLRELAKAKKVSHVVVSLQSNLAKLKELMSDKPRLLEIALRLFEEHIAAKTPNEAAKLITMYGPKIMAQVGRCRRLYEATRDVTESTCGVVAVLNGIWFVAGWIVLIGSVVITFGLIFLLHKPNSVINRKFYIPATNTRSTQNRNARRKNNSPTTSDFSIQAEMDPCPPEVQQQMDSPLTERTGENEEETPDTSS